MLRLHLQRLARLPTLALSKKNKVNDSGNDTAPLPFPQFNDAKGANDLADVTNNLARQLFILGFEPVSLSTVNETTTEIRCRRKRDPKPLMKPEDLSEPKEVQFHLVRHGQATHNVMYQFSEQEAGMMKDPPLTEHGKKQCHKLAQSFMNTSNIALVLCSPLHRTFETAVHAFTDHFAMGGTIYLWSELKEWGYAPCNIGRSREVWEICAGGDRMINCQLIKHGWELDSTNSADRDDAERTVEVREGLKTLRSVILYGGEWKGIHFDAWNGEGNPEVVVVSHGAFLHHLLRQQSRKFYNAEFRTYVIDLTGEMVENQPIRVHVPLPRG